MVVATNIELWTVSVFPGFLRYLHQIWLEYASLPYRDIAM